MTDLLLSLPFIFAVSLGLSITLYLIGAIVSPQHEKTASKLAPYACGEELPARKLQVNIRGFFLYATFFMIFDISAFLLAMSFSIYGPYPAIFALVIMLALVWLFVAWRKDRWV